VSKGRHSVALRIGIDVHPDIRGSQVMARPAAFPSVAASVSSFFIPHRNCRIFTGTLDHRYAGMP